MKRLISFISLLVLVLNVAAQNYYDNLTVTEAGSLKKVASLENWMKVENLSIDGPLNNEDMLFLGELTIRGKLQYLDLSAATGTKILPKKMFYKGRLKDSTEAQKKDTCKLIGLTLPQLMVSIGDSAIMECHRLRSVTFNDSLKNIGSWAMFGCINVEALKLPIKTKNIGEYAFAKCSKLNSVVLPDSLGYISKGLFMDCDTLKFIVIPQKIKHIGDYAFLNCKLDMVECESKIPPTCDGHPFANGLAEGVSLVRVPLGTKKEYYKCNCWNQFNNILENRYTNPARK